jgi:protein SCO1/2
MSWLSHRKRAVWITVGVGTLAFMALWTGVIFLLPRVGAARLDDFGPAPSFRLNDQYGRPFASEELAGKVVLVDFIYTSCSDICPLLSEQMRTIQERLREAEQLGNRVALVSFTVDPRRDSPDALRAYADRYRADPEAWRFLTGPERELMAVIVEGFHVGVQPTPPKALAESNAADGGGYEVLHSGRVILIDRAGRIRAYYDTRDLDVDQVVRDIRTLV